MSNSPRVYFVKRLHEGATGANTINVYHPFEMKTAVDLDEVRPWEAESSFESEPLAIETDLDVIADVLRLEARIDVEPEPVWEVKVHAPKPPVPDDDIDAKAMAAAMREAARLGVPFCEKCTRARLRMEREKKKA